MLGSLQLRTFELVFLTIHSVNYKWYYRIMNKNILIKILSLVISVIGIFIALKFVSIRDYKYIIIVGSGLLPLLAFKSKEPKDSTDIEKSEFLKSILLATVIFFSGLGFVFIISFASNLETKSITREIPFIVGMLVVSLATIFIITKAIYRYYKSK